MRKVSILKHKLIKAYNNSKNWELSEFKGYPKGTYFGYKSLKEAINSAVKEYTEFYGKGLRHWRWH